MEVVCILSFLRIIRLMCCLVFVYSFVFFCLVVYICFLVFLSLTTSLSLRGVQIALGKWPYFRLFFVWLYSFFLFFFAVDYVFVSKRG